MKRAKKKAFMRTAGTYILRSLIFFTRILPLPIALALGRRLGDLMRLLSKKRYRVAIKNLKIAYGATLSDSDRERIAKESFRHFGMFSIEAMKFPYYRPLDVERLMEVDAKGAEVFQTM